MAAPRRSGGTQLEWHDRAQGGEEDADREEDHLGPADGGALRVMATTPKPTDDQRRTVMAGATPAANRA
ncbi:MAG: hypothetical protein M5U19_16545 [Microthrixaceae bacterium]|nr:hypothetical protein [Microthrixaceae bacterium]